MKFYIYVDGKLKETTRKEYRAWFSLEGENLDLPDYGITMDGDIHYISTHYDGEWEFADEPPRVFYLLYQQVFGGNMPDGGEQPDPYFTQEFFETFEEMEDRMGDLIILLESQVDPFAEGILKEDWRETEDMTEETKKFFRGLAHGLFNNKVMVVRHEDPEFIRLCLESVFELCTTYEPGNPEDRVAMLIEEEGAGEYIFIVEGYEVVHIGEEK